jgi:hypothetical protein
MIRNYNELMICITNIEKQIHKLKTEQQKQIYNLNFRKAKIVLSQQQLIELQILNYIGYYEEKIKDRYLESKLYSPKLKSLKKFYQTKTIADDLIYCLMQLIMEYDELKNDLWIFSSLHLNHALAIKEKIEILIFTMEKIHFELANAILLSNAKIKGKQIIHYNQIVDFFHNYYTCQIENLQEKLRSIESGSEFIQSLKKLVNPVTKKMIQFEIENKKESEEITIELDSILNTKQCFEKLNKIIHEKIFI